jgi:hypothetical protein
MAACAVPEGVGCGHAVENAIAALVVAAMVGGEITGGETGACVASARLERREP